MFANKQPASGPRKTVSKKKQLQDLERVTGSSSRPSSRPASRVGSRVGSRVNSDNEDSDHEFDAADGEEDFEELKQADSSWEAQLKDAIEDLNEKRSSTREDALTKLQTMISNRFTADVLDTQRDEFMDLLKKSIKKGGTRESVLAANVISLVFITIGEDDEKMFTDLAPLLKYTITNHEQTEVKAACIHALGTACFISSTPQPSHLPTYDLLSFFSDIALSSGASVNAPQNAETLAAALEAFGVLYAGLFPDLGPKQITMQARRFFNNIIPGAKTLLEHPSVEVRVAAGETIALMLEILDHYQRQREDGEFSDDEDVEETYNEDDPEDLEEVTGDFRYEDLNGLVAALGALSTDSNKHRSKKERSAGRSAFRDILKSVESQERPTESLKLKDYDVEFDGWVEIVQLHYLRDRLTSGLQTHFVHNTMIHTILPSTAILYSPGVGSGTFVSGSRLAATAAVSSQVGSKAGSRAGSRPSSSMGIYADAEDAKAELDKVDRKYLNAEMAKMRQVQRKKERNRGKFEEY
ncbi:interferon-related developmental regulator-domain-containing protein [Gamsiella multidivaricata]|uniref:interferon-related developmental regulator-domain-containing protein n=1 Tax=Gamsiella multidivaricata TaxID=101098 RepID=UPI00221EEC72|nr:interferon-related developmental regulator-domain-containing protein [Gamsiella multidivaricata]KAG0353308.1 Interferon- developmental regulator 1 [Gamsiella multidivaricata]KAI7825337.1 interferon-related developmental regulator-domain-containing protein [Gamsiella multidivaricata]